MARSYYDRYNYRPIRWNFLNIERRAHRDVYPTRYVTRVNRNYYPSYQQPYYADNDYYDDDDDNYYGGYNDDYYDNRNDGFDWKNILLQTLVSSFLPDSNLLGGENYYDDNYYPNNNYVNYAYAPQGYRQYGVAQPYYAAYNRNDYGYGNSYGYNNDMVNEVYSRGYCEGFEAGQRSAQYGDQYYNDPYVLQNGSYYPYSASLSSQRELLSQGYQIGYRDAMNNQNSYYEDNYDNSSSDLVGLLLENVLSIS